MLYWSGERYSSFASLSPPYANEWRSFALIPRPIVGQHAFDIFPDNVSMDPEAQEQVSVSTDGYGQGQSAGVGTQVIEPGQTYPARQWTDHQLRLGIDFQSRLTTLHLAPSLVLSSGSLLLRLLLPSASTSERKSALEEVAELRQGEGQ